jgi:hypothetical protein
MNIRTVILSLTLILFPMFAFAGTGHDHGAPREPVNQQQAEQTASQIVKTFVGKGIIEKSWSSTTVEKAEQKQFGDSMEWVVSYKNEAATDPEKRTLYIFMTLSGEYLAANYTGN